MREKNIKLAFIQPFMPEMAPIEKYFTRLKRMIFRKTVNTKMSWQSKQADNILNYYILKLIEDEVSKLWFTFTKELRNGVSILGKIIKSNMIQYSN